MIKDIIDVITVCLIFVWLVANAAVLYDTLGNKYSWRTIKELKENYISIETIAGLLFNLCTLPGFILAVIFNYRIRR